MMAALSMVIFGLVVGAVARLVMPGRDPMGWTATLVLGIAGSIVGGLIGRAMHVYGPGQPAGFLMSFLGAIILLSAYRAFSGRRVPRV